MLKEVLEYLNLSPGKVIVDATIGTGGHSEAILNAILPAGRLIGIDRDDESLRVSSARLKSFKDSCSLIHNNFSEIDNILKGLNIEKIDGILFDLGISTYQLDDPLRGFSFQYEGPLDMRFDRSGYICAYDLVNNLNEEEISALLWNFGQERWHNRIAHLLVEERERQPITTTQQLADIVVRALPYKFRHRYHKIHPATRTFQAVRIAVNRELEVLEKAINKAVNVLSKGARICVISFHSLEDRIVKHNFRRMGSEGLVKVLTPKPLTPHEDEVKKNSSSRSAHLRVAEKL
jgi:16S rRNA (cytosine1402-N4)-methyltransferase